MSALCWHSLLYCSDQQYLFIWLMSDHSLKKVISSMNLYEFSEKNNREMGILIDIKDDKEIYNDSFAEINYIIKHSETIIKSNSESKEQVNINIIQIAHSNFLLNTAYQKQINFYLPALREVLKLKYPLKKLELESDYLTIEKFKPKVNIVFSKIRLEVVVEDGNP
jgi:hypothetical protein